MRWFLLSFICRQRNSECHNSKIPQLTEFLKLFFSLLNTNGRKLHFVKQLFIKKTDLFANCYNWELVWISGFLYSLVVGDPAPRSLNIDFIHQKTYSTDQLNLENGKTWYSHKRNHLCNCDKNNEELSLDVIKNFQDKFWYITYTDTKELEHEAEKVMNRLTVSSVC